MLYGVINDVHYGARNNNPNFYNYQRNFFTNVFFTYLQRENIRKVFFLGDLVDNRSTISHLTYKHLNKDFLEPLADLDIDVEMIVGNHDCYYKSTNDLNFLREYVAKNYDFNIYDQEAVEFDKFILVPWINNENKQSILKTVEKSKAKYCLGHFDIIGAEMSKGRFSNVGQNKELFKHFDLVLSGHYHNRSVIDNIRYVGNPFHFNWDDYKYTRGFTVLDDENKKLKFINNPYSIYSVFEYDENIDQELDKATGTYCRVYIKNKTSETKFNDFMSRLNGFEPIDVNVIENMETRTILNESKEIVIDDTRNIFKNYLKEAVVPNKDKVWNLFERVYEKANQK